MLGKKRGKPSIIYKLAELGLCKLQEDQLSKATSMVKTLGTDKRGLVTDEESMDIVKLVKASAWP
jgi:methanogen homocitrate synthase